MLFREFVVPGILLDEKYSEIAKKMIFVAGERVIKDPLAIPFSMGCDLLCIYSKKHINNIPKLKEEKLLHNRKTMQVMRDLLSEGGQIIYVAPSGGRDRPNNKKEIEIAPFDSQSIEMFYLISKRAKKKTHFFPLTLSTYNFIVLATAEYAAMKRLPLVEYTDNICSCEKPAGLFK